MSGTAGRLLNLLSLLQTSREWPGSELAQRLEVSLRTVRRDIERLRELGYPVQATMGAEGGYRLVAGTAMPPLLLDDEEAVAIAVGLRTATHHAVNGIEHASVRAMAKLQQVLPSRLRKRVGALSAATVAPTALEGPSIDPEILTVLAVTATNSERLRFAYEASDGTESRRLVEPYRLVTVGRRWYLVAYDNDRGDWRIFRVDRIRDPQPTRTRYPSRPPPAADAAAFVTAKLYSFLPTHRAVATVHAPADRVRDRLVGAAEEVKAIDEHTCLVRSHADTVEWLAHRLVMLGDEFEVHEPPELVSYLKALGARALRAAG